ncbi:hypothetical protein [Deinococcus sp. 6GRE01]|nr:hypothetical protein [Deinococcus sp. 6GRE01]MCD0155991.1 hypothetical protein [Deinococcus sp. 6GRE01]
MNRHDRANLEQLEWLREALLTDAQVPDDQARAEQQEGPPETDLPEAPTG